MDWLIFWTLIVQIVIACILLAFPVGLFVLIVSAGARKTDRTHKIQ